MSVNRESIDAGAARVRFPHAVPVTADFNKRLQIALWLRTTNLNYLWVANDSRDLMHSGEFCFQRGRDATLFELKWSEHVVG